MDLWLKLQAQISVHWGVRGGSLAGCVGSLGRGDNSLPGAPKVSRNAPAYQCLCILSFLDFLLYSFTFRFYLFSTLKVAKIKNTGTEAKIEMAVNCK